MTKDFDIIVIDINRKCIYILNGDDIETFKDDEYESRYIDISDTILNSNSIKKIESSDYIIIYNPTNICNYDIKYSNRVVYIGKLKILDDSGKLYKLLRGIRCNKKVDRNRGAIYIFNFISIALLTLLMFLTISIYNDIKKESDEYLLREMTSLKKSIDDIKKNQEVMDKKFGNGFSNLAQFIKTSDESVVKSISDRLNGVEKRLNYLILQQVKKREKKDDVLKKYEDILNMLEKKVK